MLTVRELIEKLKKMPQDWAVGFSDHGNSEFEVYSWISGVRMQRKCDFNPKDDPAADTAMIATNPDEWVVIRE